MYDNPKNLPSNLAALIALSRTTNPVFQGTDEERQKNRDSHFFDYENGRCVDCDCRLGGVWHDFPCTAWQRAEGVGDIATSTQSDDNKWTDVSLTAHYSGWEGVRFWQVNATRKGTDWLSIERFDDFTLAHAQFINLTQKVGA